MELNGDKAASKREQNESSLSSAEREQARQLHCQRMMMLDIDGVLTQHNATPTDVLTAAQALAVSAIGDLCNKSAVVPDGSPAGQAAALHKAADAIADQIRAAMHARINEGHRPDW